MTESPQPSRAAASNTIRLAVVSNIPAPYRVPVFDRVAAEPGIDLLVIYCAATEPDRRWDLPVAKHKQVFLTGRVYERGGRFIHWNPGVWRALSEFDPQVVVTTGFNPTHLLAYAFAMWRRRRHVVMTDGTYASEIRLTLLHRCLRHIVFATSRAFIVASQGGWRLLRSYRVAELNIHFSPLCANTSVSWAKATDHPADIDLLFSGRLVEAKNASFALKVAQGVAARIGRRVRLAFLGSGPLEPTLRQEAAALAPEVETLFAGHVAQQELPRWFHRSKLFLFPTRWDPWGVVANEALLAGVPVLVSPHAGAAGELVVDDVNGKVLPIERDSWVAHAAEILTNANLHARYSAAALNSVAPYNFENAGYGIIDATRQAIAPRAPALRLSQFVRSPRVVCVQRRLTHYRVPLFDSLRRYLRERDVDFVLVHGAPAPSELSKKDEGYLPWATHAPCRYLVGERVCWQDVSVPAAGADLLIVTQENQNLYNLLAMTVRRPSRLAFWGHGRNFQSMRVNGLKEQVKRWTARHVDWWFAYTELSADVVRSLPFPAERITTLDNAVDTAELVAECKSISDHEVQEFRTRWDLADGPVGLFIGSLYAEKRIAFLLESAGELARRLPGFHLVIVGNGPDSRLAQAAARQHKWARYLDVRRGREKAVCLRAAQVILNPGLVGLGILDAFAAGVPMVTTDSRLHSPEIAYLRHGENGLMTEDSVSAYVDASERLLRDRAARERMATSAAQSAMRYTIENMTRNFGEGILAALNTARH